MQLERLSSHARSLLQQPLWGLLHAKELLQPQSLNHMPREQLVGVTLTEPGHVQPSWQGPQQMSPRCMLRELRLLCCLRASEADSAGRE